MNKLFLVFILLVCSIFNAGKAEQSEENTESSKSEEESDSIQVVQRDVVANKQEKSLVKYDDDNPQDEESYTETFPVKIPNTTQAEAKYDAFFEDLTIDSGEIPLENRDANIEMQSIPTVVPNETHKKYNNGQEKSAVVFEDITKAYTHDDKSQEDSKMIEDDEHDWRSAEDVETDEKKHENEDSIDEDDKDFSGEDYMDKNIEIQVKGRMDTRHPERKGHYHSRPTNVRQYGQSEDHGMLDSEPMRRFGDMMVPRFRPVLTRSGIVYAPSLFPMQTGPSLLERLSGRSWAPNRVHMNQEPELYKQRQSRVIGVSQYEDSKMLDEYNEFGPNMNTYSYTPVRQVTTQAPPQQIVAPNKFDVFQKLVDASNHPKSQKRKFDEFPGNYQSQRQYPESYGGYNPRRVRRNARDEPSLKDI